MHVVHLAVGTGLHELSQEKNAFEVCVSKAKIIMNEKKIDVKIGKGILVVKAKHSVH